MDRTQVVDDDVTADDILAAAASAGDSGERVTFVMQSPTPLVVRAARNRIIDLVAKDPETIIVDGVTRAGIAPLAVAGRRYAWGRLAVERVLILSRGDATQSELAAAAGISQQAVSKILRGSPRPRSHKMLLESWVREYPAAAGASSMWLSVAEPWDQAGAVARYLAAAGVPHLVSGDPAQAVLAPWRLPQDIAVYVDHLVPLSISGFVPANESPTVTLKVPADPTIWTTSQWYSSHRATAAPWPIPDPLIVLADMYRARGVGAFEAADVLRQAIADGRLCQS
jgi:hypothetical protein